MFITPVPIGAGGPLIELGVGVAEHEPDVEFRVLCLHQDVFLPVGGEESSFGFDDDAVLQNEVRGVCVIRSWLLELYLEGFVAEPRPLLGKLVG